MIVGFSITEMAAEKHAAKQGELNINYNADITDVEEAEVSAFDEPLARIHFDLDITYTQGDEEVAGMDFAGTVLWQDDAAELIEQWDEEDGLPGDVGSVVTNHLFRKCLTKAVGMADALDLPSPVPMPQVSGQQ